MPSMIDVIIVGSGPAGVSAAFPLVEAGLKVLMLDVGEKGVLIPKGLNLSDVRQQSNDQWRLFLGKNFSALDDKKPSSPKCRAPSNEFVFEGFHERYALETENFNVAGSLASGGLSNAWGAGVSCFDDNDLKDFPISTQDIHASYKSVAKRMGISGEADDMADFHGDFYSLQPPLKLEINADLLLKRYKRRPKVANSRGIVFGRTRHAVKSTGSSEDGACQYCGLCIWGCAYGSIYSAQHDLDRLKRFDNFTYQDGAYVERFVKTENFIKVNARATLDDRPLRFHATKLVMAAGALASAKIVLTSLGMTNHEIRVLSTPIVAFAMTMPERVGRTVNSDVFSMGQLSFRVDDVRAKEGYAFGSVMPASTILANEYIKRAPLSYPLSRSLIRFLQPSMLLANCFLSSGYGNHYMQVTNSGEVKVRGAYRSDIGCAIAELRSKLVATFVRYGIGVLPGGFQVTMPGEDIHYAGTLPMRDHPGAAELYKSGELAGVAGVYVVDGAALSTLPPKSHTFTIMANANRIAAQLVVDHLAGKVIP
jgi:choline dehydrogenase-like flavoprotein